MPRPTPKRRNAFKKGLRDAVAAAESAHPGKRISLYFQDEARVGQKGRRCHRWWLRGQRPPGLCDHRFDWTYIFGAVQPVTREGFALVLPEVSTRTMTLFLAEFAKTLPPNEHAVMVLDGAGWHASNSLATPDNITLVPLPPYSPESNPVERIWLFLRERFLSFGLWADREDIIDACCDAWNALIADTDRIKTLCYQPWLQKVIS
nr:IS630 family transposase [Telmatospirillum siberiense]